MMVELSSQLLASFHGRKGNYIKSFLINDSINANLWQSRNENLKEWIGKPGVLYEKDCSKIHPESDTKEKSLKDQEKYRVSTIIDAGTDSRTGNKYVIEEVHDDDVFGKIKSGEIKFRSPSVWPDKSQMRGFVQDVTSSTPLHLAMIDVPAYGEQAKISGICTDTEKKCKHEFAPLVANTMDSRSEYTRTIPFTSFNHEQEKEKTIMEETSTKEKEELKALRAEIDELKKQVNESRHANEPDKDEVKDAESKKGSGDDEDHKNSKDANSDDPKNKEETKKANQLEKELEKEKAKTASLTKFVTENMVNDMIAVAQSNGTPEKQLVAMKKDFESMDIDSLRKTRALVASFNPNMSSAEIPDPAHALSASAEDISDDDLLRRLYS